MQRRKKVNYGYGDVIATWQKLSNNAPILFQVDPDYMPSPMERREVFGLTLEQRRNDFNVTPELFKNIVSEDKWVGLENGEEKKLSIPLLLIRQVGIDTIILRVGSKESIP